MTCIRFHGGILCVSPFYRLRLEDGTCVYMDWHHYCGPTFYKDKNSQRMIDEWWENELICKALDWFQQRGNKA